MLVLGEHFMLASCRLILASVLLLVVADCACIGSARLGRRPGRLSGRLGRRAAAAGRTERLWRRSGQQHFGGFRGGPPGRWLSGRRLSGRWISGGGSPFGGNPSRHGARADTNNNNILEPDELQSGYGRFVQRMAERAGLNTNQPLRVDQVIAAVDPVARQFFSSTPVAGQLRPSTRNRLRCTQDRRRWFPDLTILRSLAARRLAQPFDDERNRICPLEKRFDERVLERAEGAHARARSKSQWRSRWRRIAEYRGDPPILTNDTNTDGVISLEELALRYQARDGGSGGPGGYPGGPGGPPGYGGFPGRGYSGGGFPGSSYSPKLPSSSSELSPPFHRLRHPPAVRQAILPPAHLQALTARSSSLR